MDFRLSFRYLLGSIALLVVLVAVYTGSVARRTQADLQGQLEQKALALAEAVEAGSLGAIRSNALMETMIAARLADNARLIDELLRYPMDPGDLVRIGARNHLRRIDLLDLDGRPWTPPRLPSMPMRRPDPSMRMPGMPIRPPMMMGRMMEERERSDSGAAVPPPMMRYMWGRRWAAPESTDTPRPPAPLRENKFWEGSVFGVAVSARSFPGIIAVHADADYILNFRTEMGVERQIQDVARQAGIVSVALWGPDLTALAHSDPALVGTRRDDAVLARALADRRVTSRFVTTGDQRRVLEVIRPVTRDESPVGLLGIQLSTEQMQRAWRNDLRDGGVLAGVVLLAGAVGLALIFQAQRRRLRDARALEAETTRRERLAALGDVAAAFAHEVRNPLNAVSMGLQRLRGEFTAEPAQDYARFVDLMQGEVRRLNGIVEEFISLARPLALEPAPLDVAALLREVAALTEDQARSAGVTVRVIVADDLPTLVADHDRLEQVLLNLALNALQAMPKGGALSLEAQTSRDRVTITVADAGEGIAPDVLARIFDPYFTTKSGGLGLGLTIARRIVEAHGGTLDVDSTPGVGSRFRVRLPRRTR